MDIQQENLQQNHVLKEYFSNKENGREENDEVLDVVYTLFTTIKLRKIWKQHH